jgi:hypothetical protein
MTTKEDVLAFIVTQATSADLQEFADAAKVRKASVARSMRPGTPVVINGISPKYLNGLKGTVKVIEKNRCTVTLDAVSTQMARVKGTGRFYIAPDATSYDLSGIPLVCAVAA